MIRIFVQQNRRQRYMIGKLYMITSEYSQIERHKLCKKFQELATSKGITQDELAAKTGLKRNNISRIFSGKYSTSIDHLILIASALDTRLIIK